MSEELREAGEGLGVQKETIPVREEQARPRGCPSSGRGRRWGGEGDGRSRGLRASGGRGMTLALALGAQEAAAGRKQGAR